MAKKQTSKEKILHGGSGYVGAEKREDALMRNEGRKKICYKVNRRPSHIREFSRSRQYIAKKRANGDGNIRKRKDGRWEGRYVVGRDPDIGKMITKNVLGKTQTEVKEKLRKAIDNSKQLDFTKEGKYTIGQ